MPKVILLIENGFEDAEAVYPYYRLKEEGYEVDVVAPVPGVTYKGKYGYPVIADKDTQDVGIAEYAGIIIPGGQAPDQMRMNDAMVEMVKQADKHGLVIGAIGHGLQMLIEADIVRQRNVTCYKSIITDILNAGAIYHDLEVIMDDNLVTARIPADLPSFCLEILSMLKQERSYENGGCGSNDCPDGDGNTQHQ